MPKAKRKKRTTPAKLAALAAALKRRHPGMNVNELIKFLVTRPDRKRKKGKAASSSGKSKSSAAAASASQGGEPIFRRVVNDYTAPSKTPEPAVVAAAPHRPPMLPAPPAVPRLPAPPPLPPLPPPPPRTPPMLLPGPSSSGKRSSARTRPPKKRPTRIVIRDEEGVETDVTSPAIRMDRDFKDVKRQLTFKENELSAAKRAELEKEFKETARELLHDTWRGTKAAPKLSKLQRFAGEKKIPLQLTPEDDGVPKKRNKTGPELVDELLVAGHPEIKKSFDEIVQRLKASEKFKPLLSGNGSKAAATGRALHTDEIDKLMSKVPGYQGTIARNEPLKTKWRTDEPPGPVSWVMNLDKLGQKGSHWVAILITPKSAEYYDSFGDPPGSDVTKAIVEEAERLWPENIKTFKVNTVKHQDERSASCGWFAMKFIRDRLSGKSFKEVSGFENEVRKREKDVNAFERKYPKFVQIGKGLFDGPKDSMPYTVKRTLERHGDEEIREITIGRTPVQSLVRSAMNMISLGKLNDALRKYNFDDLYHLFCIVKTTKGTSLRVEKNATAKVETGSMPGNATTMRVPNIRPGTKVNDLFKHSSRPGFWLYRALGDGGPQGGNCQGFILDIITSIGAMTPELRAFIKQDTGKLLGEIGRQTVPTANLVTDIGGKVENLKDKAMEIADRARRWLRGRGGGAAGEGGDYTTFMYDELGPLY